MAEPVATRRPKSQGGGFALLVRACQKERRSKGEELDFAQAAALVAPYWQAMEPEEKKKFKDAAHPEGERWYVQAPEGRRCRPRPGEKPKPKVHRWRTLKECVDNTHLLSYHEEEPLRFGRKRAKDRVNMWEELVISEADKTAEMTERRMGLTVVPFDGLWESNVWEDDEDEGAFQALPAEICVFHFTLAHGIQEATIFSWAVEVEEETDLRAHAELTAPGAKSAAHFLRKKDDGSRRFSAMAQPAVKVAKELAELTSTAKTIWVAADEWDKCLGALQWLHVIRLKYQRVPEDPPLNDPSRFRCVEDLVGSRAAFIFGHQARDMDILLQPDWSLPWPWERCRFHRRAQGKGPGDKEHCAVSCATRLAHAAMIGFEAIRVHGPPRRLPPKPLAAAPEPTAQTAQPVPKTYAFQEPKAAAEEEKPAVASAAVLEEPVGKPLVPRLAVLGLGRGRVLNRK